jgi:hypothetical protein
MNEIGEYLCVMGHAFEVRGGRLSPFEPKPCPTCGCAGGLQRVTTRHYPEEWTDAAGKKRLTCICGEELPCPKETKP